MNNFADIVKNKTNDELLKMVYEFDQWSPGMLLAIEEELARRDLLPGDIKSRKQELVKIEDEQLSKGKEAGILGQVVGWVCIFGIFGIFIGHHYAYAKIRNKYTGQEYFRYDASSRKSGSWLFYISIGLTIMALLYGVIKRYPI